MAQSDYVKTVRAAADAAARAMFDLEVALASLDEEGPRRELRRSVYCARITVNNVAYSVAMEEAEQDALRDASDPQ